MVEITENRTNMTYRVRVLHGNEVMEIEFFKPDLEEIAEFVMGDRVRAVEAERDELRHRLDIVDKVRSSAPRVVEREALKLLCKLYAEN